MIYNILDKVIQSINIGIMWEDAMLVVRSIIIVRIVG